jgi:hypothetical protein
LPGAHTYARSLPSLDQAVREVVVLAADLPDEAMPELVLDHDYHTADPGLSAFWGSRAAIGAGSASGAESLAARNA